MSSREIKFIGSLGIALVILGVAANQWTLQWVTGYSGEFGLGKSLGIALLQLAMIGTGALLIWQRNTLRLTEIGLTAASIAISLVAAEWVLRYVDTSQTEFKVFRPNPHATGSYRLLPNLDFDFIAQVNQEKVVFEILTNSHGMRWREVSVDKPVGVERIAFLGDSFTFGESADRVENSFSGIFESSLQGNAYEVLNFGVDGYGIDDSGLYLAEEIMGFEPDYCFLMFFAGNDFRDTYLGLDKFDISTGLAKWNWAVLEEKIPAPLRGGSHSNRPTPEPNLLERSKLYTHLRSLWKRFQEADAEAVAIETIDPAQFTIEEKFTAFNYWIKADYDDVMLKAKDAALEELARIEQLTAQNGVQLVIVAIPMEEQVYAATWQGEDPRGTAFDIRKPQAYVEQFARDNAIPYLDLLPHLRKYVATTGRDVYPNARQKGGDIHFNNEGHAVTGRLLADFFASQVARPTAAPVQRQSALHRP